MARNEGECDTHANLLGSELERLGYEPIQHMNFRDDVAEEMDSLLHQADIQDVVVLPLREAIGSDRISRDHYQIYVLKK